MDETVVLEETGSLSRNTERSDQAVKWLQQNNSMRTEKRALKAKAHLGNHWKNCSTQDIIIITLIVG
jgi:hypothetical protein